MKKLLPLLFVLVLGLFFRTYQISERFLYAHDNDLASWIVKDIIVDRHLRLVGQETSAQGIFVGPLFYYALIPFYLLTRMDPIGTLGFSVVVAGLALTSIYFVVKKLYGARPALFAGLIYGASQGINLTEREVVPTTPVMLWTIWFFYAINLVWQGKKSGLLIAAVLFSLVWHINLALILLTPLVLINLFRFKIKDFFLPIAIFLILSSPLFVFEVRHNFLQTKSLTASLSGLGGGHGQITDKVFHVVQYASKNINNLFWQRPGSISIYLLPAIFLGLIFYLSFKKLVPGYTLFLIISWLVLFVIFFALHPINLSEYYLNGMNIIWIMTAALFLANQKKVVSLTIISLFFFHNLYLLYAFPVNASGYIQKKAIVQYIAADAAKHNFPCAAVSYMTDVGYNFGYRYFFWLKKVKMAPVNSLAPVYTIVFPHPRANRLDETFGALGIVLPDYQRYNSDGIAVSCSGGDSNLTDSMFGFTK